MLTELKSKWNGRPLQELLRWLYRIYPEWATNTRLTSSQSFERRQVQKVGFRHAYVRK